MLKNNAGVLRAPVCDVHHDQCCARRCGVPGRDAAHVMAEDDAPSLSLHPLGLLKNRLTVHGAGTRKRPLL